jgi:hypothetical protein
MLDSAWERGSCDGIDDPSLRSLISDADEVAGPADRL